MVRDQYGTERKIRLARKRGQTIQNLEGHIRNFGLHPKGTEKPLKNGKNGSERGGCERMVAVARMRQFGICAGSSVGGTC